MSQGDLWEKAVVCAKAALASGDPKKRVVLVHLGEFWLNLALAEPFISMAPRPCISLQSTRCRPN